MTNIFIFKNASRAAGYGIGTYVNQLSEIFSAMPDTKVSYVDIFSETKEFTLNKDDKGHTHYLIPTLNGQVESETYCRSIFFFLARNVDVEANDQIVFQFNYFQHYPLAILLKSWCPKCTILLTVHYMNWCFHLEGDVHRMKQITKEEYEPTDDKEKQVVSSFSQEKLFLHLADAVLVLSNSTKGVLIDDYKVRADKIHLVYNGIGTQPYIRVCGHKRTERTILFVGRLEKEKGLRYLVDAFIQIADAYPDSNLVIVGDGDFQPYLAQSRKLPGRVIFLGKMNKDEIEEVYRSAYIGVVPSFHEQCSYTAIEMMRHGIPVVGTDSIGLNEMLDATPELQAHIHKPNFNEDDFVSQLALRIKLLLSDETAYRQASDAVHQQYGTRYTITTMANGVQKTLSATLTAVNRFVSPDYLPHIDYHMLSLINKQPDIDINFYGISGIGVYLWWRVLQLEKEDAKNLDIISLIKEHLIYYLDWVEGIIATEPLPTELVNTLTSMQKHLFFPTKVSYLLKQREIVCKNNSFPSEQTILHNALKICTCKI